MISCNVIIMVMNIYDCVNKHSMGHNLIWYITLVFENLKLGLIHFVIGFGSFVACRIIAFMYNIIIVYEIRRTLYCLIVQCMLFKVRAIFASQGAMRKISPVLFQILLITKISIIRTSLVFMVILEICIHVTQILVTVWTILVVNRALVISMTAPLGCTLQLWIHMKIRSHSGTHTG